MKKPEPNDFGITAEEYADYHRVDTEGQLGDSMIGPAAVVMGLVLGIVVLFIPGYDEEGPNWSSGFGWLVAFSAGFGGFCASGAVLMILRSIFNAMIARSHKARMARSNIPNKIKLYQDAQNAHQIAIYEAERARHKAEKARLEAEKVRRRRVRQHWMSLSGLQFEDELASVYRQLGYLVESTPKSGDQGIDLVLKKNGKTTIVQCKRHKQAVGPAIARELYGSLIASRANEAILACTAGFTTRATEFVQGKPIVLMSATELVSLAESINEKQVTQEIQEDPPSCPIPVCGSPMVRRTGKFGAFWGCARYPSCKGTRRIP